MAGFRASPEHLADAARACRDAAAEIQTLLAGLRTYVLSLGAHRVGLPTARFQALMIGYDIYAQMLGDALNDIASDLQECRDATDQFDTRCSPVGQAPRSEDDHYTVRDASRL
jgi:uncharacterized protein YukE